MFTYMMFSCFSYIFITNSNHSSAIIIIYFVECMK